MKIITGLFTVCVLAFCFAKSGQDYESKVSAWHPKTKKVASNE